MARATRRGWLTCHRKSPAVRNIVTTTAANVRRARSYITQPGLMTQSRSRRRPGRRRCSNATSQRKHPIAFRHHPKGHQCAKRSAFRVNRCFRIGFSAKGCEQMKISNFVGHRGGWLLRGKLLQPLLQFTEHWFSPLLSLESKHTQSSERQTRYSLLFVCGERITLSQSAKPGFAIRVIHQVAGQEHKPGRKIIHPSGCQPLPLLNRQELQLYILWMLCVISTGHLLRNLGRIGHLQSKFFLDGFSPLPDRRRNIGARIQRHH